MRTRYTVLAICATTLASAQPGTLDLTFGNAGEAIIDAGSGVDLVYDMAIQPDDKIVVVGQFGSLGASAPQDAFVIRYNADGTPDTDFGTNGQVTWTGTGGQDRLMAVAIDAQGRIVAAGETQVTGGETQMFALRLLADGSFDTSYSGDGVATRAGSSYNDGSYARDVLCMPDGGIMVFGYAHWNFSTPNINVVSFWKTTATGGIDPNVGGGSSATHTDLFNDDISDMGNSVALRADGRFVGCTTTGNAPNQRMGYATFDNNGNNLLADFENTYDLSTGNDMARSIVLMPDDRCVLAGSVGYQSALVGVMPNASYDLSCGTDGVTDVQVGSSSTSIYSAIRQPWDKVLITGGYSDGSIVGMFLGRYHADGTPDAGFGTNGFATHVPVAAPPLTFDLIAGDHSNLTYRVEDAAGGAWVLRRPPLGQVLATAHDMGREHAVISALGPTTVPVPAALGLCTDEAVNGAPFYVMEFVAGEVVRDAGMARRLPPEQRLTAGHSIVDVLAQIHAVDVDAIGLADLGRREGYIARQLKRWHGQWEKSKTRDLALVDEVHAGLLAAIPEQGPSGIVHGDYRLDNCLVGADGQVVAVLDWEICTLGDPLADAGLLMVYWSEPSDEHQIPANSPTGVGGFPSRAEMLERYAEKSGRDVSRIDYYMAFGYWKLACIVEGVYARYVGGAMGNRGAGTGGEFDVFAQQVDALAQAAAGALERSA